MRKKAFIYKLVLFMIVFVFSVYAISGSPKNTAYSATYSWGSSGETVRTIQTKLIKWGYLKGVADGKFGSATFEGVKYFQRKNGLKDDGIAGKQTLEALGIFETATDVSSQENTSSSGRESDIWLLACIINGEARGEPYIGQVAVGAVVLNRVKHASFPNTISGVIYQSGAFDAVKDGQINLTPTQSCLNASRDAMNGWDPVDGAIYYWNPKTATNKWIKTLTIMKIIENHAFAKN